ncbi:DUF6963 family protein [Bradyrhizobium sp. UFLA05-109]
MAPADAAHAVTSESPEADCGLICVDVAGRIGVANTERVLRRPDIATVLRRNDETGAAVVYSTTPSAPTARWPKLAAAIAIEVMTLVSLPRALSPSPPAPPIGMGQRTQYFATLQEEGVYLGSAVWLGTSSRLRRSRMAIW